MIDFKKYLDKQKFVVVDGAFATELERLGLDIKDPLWSALALIDHTDMIENVHTMYLEAGADIIISSSYQATVDGFVKKGIDKDKALSLIALSVDLAVKARDEFVKSSSFDPAKRQIPLVAASVGPYGAYLEKSLRDPSINTSFSIRSLCTPGTGPDSKYEYRNVQLVVTFDAVGAPGYEIASKRYAAGNESFEEINVERKDLDRIVESHAGMEDIMLTDRDICRIYHDTKVNVCGQNTLLTGEHSYFDANGKLRDCASIIYGRC